MTCAICREETTGSRGPASGYLRPICPSCGDRVDNELLQQCVAQSRHMNQAMDLLLNPRPTIEVETLQ